MEYHKLPLEVFMAIYKKVPRVAVELVILSESNQILLSKRLIPPYKGRWHIPGGSILFKEPIPHAVKRVAKEELGLNVEIVNLIGIQEYFRDAGRHTVSLIYRVKLLSGILTGSCQGKNLKYFGKFPNNCIQAQKKFLLGKGVI